MLFARVVGMCCIVLALWGCSDDRVGPAPGEFEQLCGQDGPIKLIDIDPALRPSVVSGREIGERYVFYVATSASDETHDVHREMWSVGRCGEDPLELAEHIGAWPYAFEPWPELVFACDETSGVISAIDPTGAAPPNPVFESGDCWVYPTAAGVLTILAETETETGPLVLQPWPSDPLSEAAAPIMVLDDVRARATPSGQTGAGVVTVFASTDDELFVVTGADELVVVELDELTTTVLAEHVRKFDVDRSGRWLLWQDTEITNDDPDRPEGPLFVLDRETGAAKQLEDAALTDTFQPFAAAPLGLLYYRIGPAHEEGEDHWVRLDDFESFAAPADIGPLYMPDASTLIVGRGGFLRPWSVFDVATGELTELYSGSSVEARFRDDSLQILRSNGGELVSIDFDGASRRLGRHVERFYALSEDEYVITPYGTEPTDSFEIGGIGSLVIIEPGTLDERYIDTNVLAPSASLLDESDDALRISYMVIDATPERHGIWLALPSK